MKTGKSKDHLQRVFLRFLYLIMGSILSLDSVMAQENLKVSGQVTDNKGEAIIGASVKVLKTGTGTISDMDGKFTIQVPEGVQAEKEELRKALKINGFQSFFNFKTPAKYSVL